MTISTTDPLIEHWEGSQWREVEAPDGDYYDDLRAADADLASDAWAVGVTDMTGEDDYAPLVQHWNGSSWRVISTPGLPQRGGLSDVAVITSQNVWVAGDRGDDEPLAARWNRTRWQTTILPAKGGASLAALAVVSAVDIWAVGGQSSPGKSRTLIAHYSCDK